MVRNSSKTTSSESEVPTSTAPTREAKTYRLMIYSHDTFGLGHLQRCLKIAQALTDRFQSLSVLIATGSSVVHRYELPQRVDYVKLPSVRKVGPEKYEGRTLSISYEKILKLRANLLLEIARSIEPDFLLVDHSPIGMKGEILPTLEYVKRHLPSCHTMLGLRDIIDDPAAVTRLWQSEGLYEKMEQFYETIFVYGDPTIYDLTDSCGFTPSLKERTVFTGFLGDNRTSVVDRSSLRKGSRQRVVVSVGGGDGATEPVLATYLKMVLQFEDEVTFASTLIAGPFVSDETYAVYLEQAKALDIELIRFVDSTTSWFAESDLVISTAGYNSVTQILQAASRCLLIPRVMHRREQLLRASTLASLGVVEMIHPEDVSPELLWETVCRLLASDACLIERVRVNNMINMNGLLTLADRIGHAMETFEKVKSDDA